MHENTQLYYMLPTGDIYDFCYETYHGQRFHFFFQRR